MKKRRTHRRRKVVLSLFVVLVVAGYAGFALLLPLPTLQPVNTTKSLSLATQKGTLAWPAGVQAAVAIPGSTILETQGVQKGVPTASTAKIITTLTVLKKYPLKPGEQGPMITLTAADVARYTSYVAQDGSVVPVQAGEQISEYQMLQAIMLPSANNIADSLAVWAYGSLPAYANAANSYLANLGLTQTHVGSDASGLAPDSVSSAQDLAKLGALAMEDPVLASIVGQSTATGLPVVGTVRNVNVLLGTSNIVGIKTGNSDQAGGVFVSASTVQLGGKPVTIVTAVAGTPDLGSALRTSLALVKSAQNNFATTNVIGKGSVVGHYKQPWGKQLAVVTDRDLIITSWLGETIKGKVRLQPIGAAAAHGQLVGTASTTAGELETSDSVSLKLADSASKPTVLWRLLHPLF